MANNTAYAMDWLQKHGYPLPAAAAMVGHATQESGVNPGAVGDNGTAKGLFQWRGDRLQGLHSFAASTGQDPNAIDTQLAFMDHELNTTEAKAGAMLRAAHTVPDAVNAGMAYERPQGYTAANPQGGHGYDNRLGEAMRLASQPAPQGGLPAMAAALQPSGFPATPQSLAAAFVPTVEDPLARQRAVAAAQDAANRKALLGGGGLAGLYG